MSNSIVYSTVSMKMNFSLGPNGNDRFTCSMPIWKFFRHSLVITTLEIWLITKQPPMFSHVEEVPSRSVGPSLGSLECSLLSFVQVWQFRYNRKYLLPKFEIRDELKADLEYHLLAAEQSNGSIQRLFVTSGYDVAVEEFHSLITSSNPRTVLELQHCR